MLKPTPVLVAFASLCVFAQAQAAEPRIVESRSVKLTQTVTLHDIPAGSESVRLWVPIPSDGPWQRVVAGRVVDAPGEWRLVQQHEGRGDFIYAEVRNPSETELSIVFEAEVQRLGVHYPLEDLTATSEIQPAMFAAALDPSAPLMTVDDRIKHLADEACGSERDPARQASLLLRAVADMADHYSKDPTKPTCGRGAAEDCLTHGGGCCTDLHSLFIAMARARGIPARIEFGYRLLDSKVGKPFDPGYRCWAEFFVPGAGWIPTDVVASDNVEADHAMRWGSLSATRIWLWHGRSFDLNPAADNGPVHTMLVGWAEIDGQPIDPLPTPEGEPSKLRRTLDFTVLQKHTEPGTPKLPE